MYNGCKFFASLLYLVLGHLLFIHLKISLHPSICAQIITSYIELSTYGSTFLDTYSDLTSCILWITCAFVDFGAEIYFYESEEDEDDDDTNKEEEEERMEKRLLISV